MEAIVNMDVNGNQRLTVAPTWATITSAVRFDRQAVDEKPSLQFPLAVPGLPSFDGQLLLQDDHGIHRDGDASLNFQDVLSSLISPPDLTIEYHEIADELYCTDTACILDRSTESPIDRMAMYNMHPQAHETNLPFIDLRGSQSDNLQHNHTNICTHSCRDGDGGQPTLNQQMIPVGSFQTPLVFLTDSICSSRLLAEYSVIHSIFTENGDEPIDQSRRPSSLPPKTNSPARRKRKRMLTMNSAFKLEAAESNQDQDEEFSSNLRNSELHVEKGAQNQHAECLWHCGPEDAQEISPHIQGDPYALEIPTNCKVMYITCSAMEQRHCETMVGVEEPTELAQDPVDMVLSNDTLMKLMGWCTEEASYEHEMPLNSCTSWQLNEAQYEVQLPLLESGRESSKKQLGCIPIMAEHSIDMDREPLLSSEYPGGSVEESIKVLFNDVPASSPNLNKRMTHNGPVEFASCILNEGYPPGGCCAEDKGRGGLETMISICVNGLSSLPPNRSIDSLGKFPCQLELLNSPSNQLRYQASELIVDHLTSSQATSVVRGMGESKSIPSDLQSAVPDLKKSLLNAQDVQTSPVIIQQVSELEVARAKQRPPRNRRKKPKGTRSEQVLPDYNQICGIPQDQLSLITIQPSEKKDSLSLKSEETGGEEKGGDQPLIFVKASNSASKRSSQYRGVTRHRYTGRYEAHLWDNSKVKTGLSKRGRQVYLGAYPNEEQAARAHDSAALKYWGPEAYINFPITEYKDQLKAMENFTKEEFVLLIRRRSPGFARGRSKYRGVTRHHQDGRWEARIGREPGTKYHYLGIFDTQEEAAMAYDRAAVECRGVNAVTNFQLSSYLGGAKKPPSQHAVPHGGEKSSEVVDSQEPEYDRNRDPAVPETSSQKLREKALYTSSQVLNSIDWLSPSAVFRIPMYRSRVLLPPSCELEGMKPYEALEGRVIKGTTTNPSKEGPEPNPAM